MPHGTGPQGGQSGGPPVVGLPSPRHGPHTLNNQDYHRHLEDATRSLLLISWKVSHAGMMAIYPSLPLLFSLLCYWKNFCPIGLTTSKM